MTVKSPQPERGLKPSSPRPRPRDRHGRAQDRLSVYRSNKGIFGQLIDDRAGHTLAAVNWIEPDLKKPSRLPTRLRRPANCSPSGRRRPGSRPASSTAAVTSTTAASRRSPKVRARGG